MRIFNETKTQELNEQELDFSIGYLTPDRLFIARHAAVEPVEEQGHYVTIREYPNGGKDVKWVVDVAGVAAKEEYDEYEDIYVYTLFTPEERKDNLRAQREAECFPIINRGQLWYDMLTETQKTELKEWYTSWLNVTETLVIPDKPEWIK